MRILIKRDTTPEQWNKGIYAISLHHSSYSLDLAHLKYQRRAGQRVLKRSLGRREAEGWGLRVETWRWGREIGASISRTLTLRNCWLGVVFCMYIRYWAPCRGLGFKRSLLQRLFTLGDWGGRKRSARWVKDTNAVLPSFDYLCSGGKGVYTVQERSGRYIQTGPRLRSVLVCASSSTSSHTSKPWVEGTVSCSYFLHLRWVIRNWFWLRHYTDVSINCYPPDWTLPSREWAVLLVFQLFREKVPDFLRFEIRIFWPSL